MNRATRITVATLGTIFGISGMNHGFFETLQGNTPTHGMFIPAIGEAQRMWPHGSEYAFTLIPNFLMTGLAAMLIGLAIVVWSIGFVHKKNGPAILLILFVVLLLAGGGVAQVLFFPWVCLISTQINAPLTWWRKHLPPKVQGPLSKMWIWCLAIISALLVFALVIGVTGFIPGVNDPDAVLMTLALCLLAVMAGLPLTFISGFAYDIVMNPSGEN